MQPPPHQLLPESVEMLILGVCSKASFLTSKKHCTCGMNMATLLGENASP